MTALYKYLSSLINFLYSHEIIISFLDLLLRAFTSNIATLFAIIILLIVIVVSDHLIDNLCVSGILPAGQLCGLLRLALASLVLLLLFLHLLVIESGDVVEDILDFLRVKFLLDVS